MRMILLGAAALALAGCAPFGLASGYTDVNIASSPKADSMRLCGALVDITTPGVSIPAIASLLSNALTTATNKLGKDPALAMRKCADMYDGLAD